MGHQNGKTYLVTGGACGIGEAIVRLASANSNNVVIADIDHDRAQALAAALGPNSCAVRLDVRSPNDWDDALDLACQRFGKLDVLVNNAGIVHPGLMGDVPVEKHRDTFEVNVFGAMNGILATLPRFRAQGHGHIATVCSLSAFAVFPVIVTYGASKAALRNLHLGFAYEERNGPVKFTIVHPTATQTPMLDYEARMGVDASFALDVIEPSLVAEVLMDAIANNRMEVSAPPEDLATAIQGGSQPELMLGYVEQSSVIGKEKLARRFAAEG